MKCRQVSRLGSYSCKEQSFHCSAPPTNSATYPKEASKSKKPCTERANVKAVADSGHPVRAPGCARARPNLKANTPYWIEFQGSAPTRSMSQHSKKSVGPMVFPAARANLVFLKDATPWECYGIRQISFLDWIIPVPLLGAESCHQTALL